METIDGTLRWVSDRQGDEVLVLFTDAGERLSVRAPDRLGRDLSMHTEEPIRIVGYRSGNATLHARAFREFDQNNVAAVRPNAGGQNWGVAPGAPGASAPNPRRRAAARPARQPAADPTQIAQAELLRQQSEALRQSQERQNALTRQLLQDKQNREDRQRREDDERRRREERERLPKLHDEWIAYKAQINESEAEEELAKRRSGRAIQPEFPLFLKPGGLGTSNPYGAGGAMTWSCKWGHAHEIPLRFKEVAQ